VRTIVLDARTATPHFPGIGRYVRSLAGALAPQLKVGERLTLLVDPREPLRLEGVESVPVSVTPFSVRQQWWVPQVLHRTAADLYHSPYYLMPYRPGTPAVLTVYDIIPLRHPEFSTRRAQLLFRLTTRLALAAADHVIAITETARQDFIEEFKLPPERMTAIPLAADPAFRPQSPGDIAVVRERYGLPEDYVLYVGSNKPHKNLVGLVEAWCGEKRISGAPGFERGKNGTLVVAGAWDERYPQARQLAERAGGTGIRWLGRVAEQDLPALYAGAVLFVFPSFFEGFGLPVLEAMACGTPVVCSRVSALPEVAGAAAVLFDPREHGALAEALQRVLADRLLRVSLREKGMARAATFSWTDTAARTLSLYRGLR
jgi:glycosyltransferase involved in cell wall biosynthesis